MTDSNFDPDGERTGQIIGHYRLTRLIGRGGMSVVYEAVHVDIGQRAAVKLLPRALSSHPGYCERFFREALAASKMNHPGLVRVFDFGQQEEGILYILMEYLDGPLLRDVLLKTPAGRLPLGTALRIGGQIASAMADAQQRGVIHCDLKPDNVKLVSDDAVRDGERVKVLDFGIARIHDSLTPPTVNHIGNPGTPAYMSPERCSGRRDIDGQSDVYALGCMLYEMLCGSTPFIGQAADLLTHHQYTDPQLLCERAADVPTKVGGFIGQLLAKQPTERPTMEQTALTLEKLAQTFATYTEVPQLRIHTRLISRLRSGWFSAFAVGVPCSFILLWWFTHWVKPIATQEMIKIDGDRFWMGVNDNVEKFAHSDAKRWNYTESDVTLILKRATPARGLRIETFYLDRQEVTCEKLAQWLQRKYDTGSIEVVDRFDSQIMTTQYAQFKDGRKIVNLYPAPEHGCIQFIGRKFIVIKLRARWPANSVSWFGATAFCKDDHNKRLPAEAEWEFAARSRGLFAYPWGNSPAHDCKDVVVERDVPKGPYRRCASLGATLQDVGSGTKDLSMQGVQDLAGSVREWVADCYRVPYPECGKSCSTETDTDEGASRDKCSQRVLRGSAWSGPFLHMQAAARSPADPNLMAGYAGFRCAKDVESPIKLNQ